ncbi:hypothetical protein CYY_001641 [Polysphondylium violaceum]|uniref:Uncharacterized protein n=1 Tax=Polysphondylium violaceum TaxID=133409 RepID=A0A8J4Q1I4_9MYCE|nr:hypothetical protein CYY_001641 [Polysphondylium violaceum]
METYEELTFVQYLDEEHNIGVLQYREKLEDSIRCKVVIPNYSFEKIIKLNMTFEECTTYFQSIVKAENITINHEKNFFCLPLHLQGIAPQSVYCFTYFTLLTTKPSKIIIQDIDFK